MIYALINKDTLVHICTSKKVSCQYLSQRGKFKEERLMRWMDSADSLLPTIKQAKTIATCLHIPFAGLYMNPKDIPLQRIPSLKNMRTLWGSNTEDDSALNIAVVDLLMERDFLIAANQELNIPTISFSVQSPKTNSPESWAISLRQQFNLDLEIQYKCTSSRQFYLYLRSKIEEKGIFVHCFTDVPLEEARGISIVDTSIPIIGINDSDRPPAKSFSIIHELVHILKRESSLCNEMISKTSSNVEEVFCNAVAGELLVPQKALSIILQNINLTAPYSKDDIAAIAKHFSVSREVIIRRLLETELISEIEYQTYSEELRKELEKNREEQRNARKNGNYSGIPKNMSREAFDRTSPAVCRNLYQGYSEDIYSKLDIAHHLNIDQKHIDKFLSEVAKWIR